MTQGRRITAEKHPWNLLGHAIVGSVKHGFGCCPNGTAFYFREETMEDVRFILFEKFAKVTWYQWTLFAVAISAAVVLIVLLRKKKKKEGDRK